MDGQVHMCPTPPWRRGVQTHTFRNPGRRVARLGVLAKHLGRDYEVEVPVSLPVASEEVVFTAISEWWDAQDPRPQLLLEIRLT